MRFGGKKKEKITLSISFAFALSKTVRYTRRLIYGGSISSKYFSGWASRATRGHIVDHPRSGRALGGRRLPSASAFRRHYAQQSGLSGGEDSTSPRRAGAAI
jgi:hypothetical protein